VRHTLGHYLDMPARYSQRLGLANPRFDLAVVCVSVLGQAVAGGLLVPRAPSLAVVVLLAPGLFMLRLALVWRHRRATRDELGEGRPLRPGEIERLVGRLIALSVVDLYTALLVGDDLGKWWAVGFEVLGLIVLAEAWRRDRYLRRHAVTDVLVVPRKR
jgi:hypothetical protein